MQEMGKRLPPRTVLAGIFILLVFPLLLVEIFPGRLKFVMEPSS